MKKIIDSFKIFIEDIKIMTSQSWMDWFNWYVLKPLVLLVCLVLVLVITQSYILMVEMSVSI